MSHNYREETYTEEKKRSVFVSSTCDLCKVVITTDEDKLYETRGNLFVAVSCGSDDGYTAWLCADCLDAMKKELRSRMDMEW